MTPDRLVHGVVAIFFLTGLLSARQPKGSALCFIAVVFGAALGSWVPDWDLIGGIGNHRSPITHSVLPAVLPLIYGRQYRLWRWFVIGIATGIASHLIWDSVDYGNVVGIPGRTNDILFLLGNSALTVGIALWLSRASAEIEYIKRSSAIAAQRAKEKAHAVAERQRKRADTKRKLLTFRNVFVYLCTRGFLTLMLPFIVIWKVVTDLPNALRKAQEESVADDRPVVGDSHPTEIACEPERPKGIYGVIAVLLTVLLWLFVFPLMVIRTMISSRKNTAKRVN
jgi:hypothetical protein